MFYVITPKHPNKGIIPPSLFIAELRNFRKKKLLYRLLNAVYYYGAANQQPKSFPIITTKPNLRNINNDKLKINFYIKKEWDKGDII